MRVEDGAPVSHSSGLKVCGSALVCDEESHPDVSWGAGGWPLEAVLQDFKDVFSFSFSASSSGLTLHRAGHARSAEAR